MKSHGSMEQGAGAAVLDDLRPDHHFEPDWVSFSTTQWLFSAAVVLLMILLTYGTLSAPTVLPQPMSAGWKNPDTVSSSSQSSPVAGSRRVQRGLLSDSVSLSPTPNSIHTETAVIRISAAAFLLPDGELSHAGAARLKILARRIHQGDLRIEFLSTRKNEVSDSVRMAEYLLRSCRVPADRIAFASFPVKSQPSGETIEENPERAATNRDSTSADHEIQLRITRTIQSEDSDAFIPTSGSKQASWQLQKHKNQFRPLRAVSGTGTISGRHRAF